MFGMGMCLLTSVNLGGGQTDGGVDGGVQGGGIGEGVNMLGR